MRRLPRSDHNVLVLLTGKADGYPIAVKIRRLLKFALRCLQMRVVLIDWDSLSITWDGLPSARDRNKLSRKRPRRKE
jgi:hypothetical protein